MVHTIKMSTGGRPRKEAALGQYQPYFNAVRGWTPQLRDGHPVVNGPMLGFVCGQGHNTFLRLTAIKIFTTTEYACDVCNRDEVEVHVRKWIEAKLGTQLQLHSSHAGAVYRCEHEGKMLKVAIGDQLEPVAEYGELRMLLPASLNENLLLAAWLRFVNEKSMTGDN